jgi:hypothetical protein
MTDAELKKAGLSPYCACRSGLYREAEYDARGIFLTYACPRCRRDKLRGYRAEVLTNPNYAADEDIDGDGDFT